VPRTVRPIAAPAQTRISCPVMALASSEQRNITVLVISFGSTARRSAAFSANSAATTSGSTPRSPARRAQSLSSNSVFTAPGTTVLARIPFTPTSLDGKCARKTEDAQLRSRVVALARIRAERRSGREGQNHTGAQRNHVAKTRSRDQKLRGQVRRDRLIPVLESLIANAQIATLPSNLIAPP